MPKTPPRRADAQRYREAAEQTLEQLDYAIDYLNRIRKHQIAAALRKNARDIAARLR